MPFPLTKRKLIRGCLGHKSAGLGCGADYEAIYETLYASHNGRLEWAYSSQFTWRFNQGGKWLRLIRPNGDILEFSHLEKVVQTGPVEAGEVIAVTGNTGKITTGPHLHVQIFSNGKRLDPETYDWESDDAEESLNVRSMFREIWLRAPARGEEMYFLKRLEYGTIKPTKKDIGDKMKYWYFIVYPNNTYSSLGNLRWQYEKNKVLLGG